MCSCGLPLRAKEVRNWVAAKYKNVGNKDANGTYLVYEERDVDGQGHVYVHHNGSNYGNGNYNWPQTTEKGKIKQWFYKIA